MQAAAAIIIGVFIALLVSGCQFFNGDTPLLIDDSQPIAYVKRPVRHTESVSDPLHPQPGSDLYIRDFADTLATPRNLTGALLNGQGDVSDPSPSYDGQTIVFSVLCTELSSPDCAPDTTWNIWTYDLETDQLNPVITDFTVRNLGDDREPVFLPDGRIAFISNRQAATQDKLGYRYVDEEGIKPAAVLHVMNRDGTQIQQISFNQTDERNPSVMADGRIMFSRLERIDGNSRYSLFTVKPDGTGIQSLYGAHSPGDAFLHAHELGDGRVIASVISLHGRWDGGALMVLDVANFSNADMPAPNLESKKLVDGGQQSATVHSIPLDDDNSRFGYYAKPFPVLDGNNDVLVSYSFYNQSVEVNLSLDEEDQATPTVSIEEEAPKYGLYVLNAKSKSLTPLLQPEEKFYFTDPISLNPRKTPRMVIPTVATNPNLIVNDDEGLVNIKSVYDTDRLGHMGPQVLTPKEKALTPIPLVAPIDPTQDSRELVADIAKLKDPAQTPASKRPARFLRVIEAQAMPPGLSQQAIGETSLGMRRIAGYTDIEPDGSAMIKVPANKPITLSVVDRYGRAFEKQSSWLHVLPGETLECKGCHAPRDTAALNQPPIAGNHPNTNLVTSSGSQFVVAQQAETMAETRARVDAVSVDPMFDIDTSDAWSSDLGINDPLENISYTNLQTPSPTNGLIQYDTHIQPIFDLPRNTPNGSMACSGCHNGSTDDVNNPSGLNLSGGVGGSGRVNSYESLLVGNALFDDEGYPVFEMVNDEINLKRQLPLVTPGFARGSYLVEKVFNEELFADRGLPDFGLDHSGMLSGAEMRLISEWIDLGAQYFNSPFDETGNTPVVSEVLSKAHYAQFISPLLDECNRCHVPFLSSGRKNNSFKATSFVLTGDINKDYLVASSIVDQNNPGNSLLLVAPTSSEGHLKPDNTYYLETTDPLYKNIVSWLEDAQQTAAGLQLSVPYARPTQEN